MFKNAHVGAGDSALAKQLEKDLDAIRKTVPIRSTTAPASGVDSITDEQMDEALDAAEDNGPLSGMTRWLASQIWHEKNARDLIAHARQSDPANAAIMEQAALNLGLKIALQL